MINHTHLPLSWSAAGDWYVSFKQCTRSIFKFCEVWNWKFTSGMYRSASVGFKIPLLSKYIRFFGFCRSVSKIHLYSFFSFLSIMHQELKFNFHKWIVQVSFTRYKKYRKFARYYLGRGHYGSSVFPLKFHSLVMCSSNFLLW